MTMLVVAWVRMWTSSPIWHAPALRVRTRRSARCVRATAARAGPATSARNTSRSMAAGVSRPNQATSPGPWLTGAKARVPPSSLSTTRTGADGPIAVAIGHDRLMLVRGLERDLLGVEQAAGLLDVGRPALRDHGGAHRPPQRVAHVGATRWPGRSAGSSARPCPARRRGPARLRSAIGTPLSSRRSTSAFARRCRRPCRRRGGTGRPPRPGRRRRECASRRCSTGCPCARMASAKSGRPTLTTDDRPVQVRGGSG